MSDIINLLKTAKIEAYREAINALVRTQLKFNEFQSHSEVFSNGYKKARNEDIELLKQLEVKV